MERIEIESDTEEFFAQCGKQKDYLPLSPNKNHLRHKKYIKAMQHEKDRNKQQEKETQQKVAFYKKHAYFAQIGMDFNFNMNPEQLEGVMNLINPVMEQLGKIDVEQINGVMHGLSNLGNPESVVSVGTSVGKGLFVALEHFISTYGVDMLSMVLGMMVLKSYMDADEMEGWLNLRNVSIGVLLILQRKKIGSFVSHLRTMNQWHAQSGFSLDIVTRGVLLLATSFTGYGVFMNKDKGFMDIVKGFSFVQRDVTSFV